MVLSTKYSPQEIEDKWYKYWLEKDYFSSKPNEKTPYTIVIPPPNVTGVLHMGHMLNNTIQDVLIRKARMSGFNACWVPGTDHASIATEAKVVKLLESQGIKKSDISRDEFLTHAWAWKDKYGGIILEQLKKLGASCDWNRTRFTMEDSLYNAVVDVFVDLYEKGLIYRGTRMVNWDPMGQTTLSDEEVIFKEINDQLHYVIYKGVDFSGELLVATARPETIAGDVAVCVNPNDDRYKHLIGKKVIIPLINREVTIISDEYIDIEFGTGVLKVTPAHDINDYNIGLKFNLPVVDTLNADGTIAEAGVLFIGKDRAVARKLWVKALEEANLLAKSEPYVHNVGHSERTDAVVEPRISTQWFMDMKSFMDKNPEVLSSVLSDEIKFHPTKLKNTYRHWLENIKDWNISRQLWWGHRIPAWYSPTGDFVVASTLEAAIGKFRIKGFELTADEIIQDPDVLDTWFSSWLWPISVFDGIGPNANKDELNYYYPTNDLVTGPDILFFWVARMIMAGYEFEGKLPFKNVYFTGLIRDKQRRKMSKSLGNSPDPLDLIEKYGADSVRLGLLLCAPAGNDILFDESQIEQGRNFCNKIWNAYRLTTTWEIAEIDPSLAQNQANLWFGNRLNEVLKTNQSQFDEFRLSDALMNIYKLVWDDFCSIYLEAVKPTYGLPMSRIAADQVKSYFSDLMKLLHPFMPFITEELYHAMNGGDVIVAEYPVADNSTSNSMYEEPLLLVSEIRNLRNSKGLSPKEILDVWVEKIDLFEDFKEITEKLANIQIVENGEFEGIGILVGKSTVKVRLTIEIDVEAEKKEILDEIKYLEGFLRSVEAKLNNERFVSSAKPEIVEKEKQKLQDTIGKMESLQARLLQLS
ncbi:MAG: valine--tRNA ligase [Bacteroidota bacterium]|jgi:valyl-tRNA synthetase